MKNIPQYKYGYFGTILFCTVFAMMTVSTKTVQAATYNNVSVVDSSVQTPNGTTVPTYIYDELTEAEYNEGIAFQQEYYPNVTVVRNPTSKYNCHSYAWYSQSSLNIHWMPDPIAYITDGSYSYLTCATNLNKVPAILTSGTKVLWVISIGNGVERRIHSGIVYSFGEIISKWGSLGLYRHEQGYCPYTVDICEIRYYK